MVLSVYPKGCQQQVQYPLCFGCLKKPYHSKLKVNTHESLDLRGREGVVLECWTLCSTPPSPPPHARCPLGQGNLSQPAPCRFEHAKRWLVVREQAQETRDIRSQRYAREFQIRSICTHHTKKYCCCFSYVSAGLHYCNNARFWHKSTPHTWTKSFLDANAQQSGRAASSADSLSNYISG